jgi:hypothetical protein
MRERWLGLSFRPFRTHEAEKGAAKRRILAPRTVCVGRRLAGGHGQE